MTDPTSDRLDALELLRECQDRVLEREGIPMLLALVDETVDETVDDLGDAAEPGDVAHPDGARLAGTMERLWTSLAASSRGGDLGQVTSVLQAAAYLDFGRGRTLL